MMTITDVRAFNRFYTGVIGVLDRGYLDSPYSLTEVRVLFELARRDRTQVADLRAALGLDAGYLSRILARLDSDGLAVREPSQDDARRQVTGLTPAGRRSFAALDERSAAEIGALLAGVPESDRARLLAAMGTIRRVLGGTTTTPYVLRPPRAGDLGWVVHRHGVRYAEEYGFDGTFEALVARVVADFGAGHDPAQEAGWIAEVDGEPVGSIFCTRAGDKHPEDGDTEDGDTEDGDTDGTTAKLRLLLVEPSARGLGIGARLVEECLRFARRAGYRRIALWTVDELAAARHLYQEAGFVLVAEHPERLFGQDVVGQTWELDLAHPA